REGISSRNDNLSGQRGVHVFPSFDVPCSHVPFAHNTNRVDTDGLKETVTVKEIKVNGKKESMLHNIEINHRNSSGGDENNEYNANGGQCNRHMLKQQKINNGSLDEESRKIITHHEDPLHCNKTRIAVEKEEGSQSACLKERDRERDFRHEL
ncbi:hypothetical protein Tco_1148356, partial [Tanacetum coccineum]